MYSREESKKIRQEFWISFGKEYPHKWLLYNTGIKEIQLKFTFDRTFAMVSIDISDKDEIVREYYFEKIESLKSILVNDYLPEVIFEKNFYLPEGKIVSRIYVKLNEVNIYKKTDWPRVKDFLHSKMVLLEDFFIDFNEIIKE
jgi:hypothetical protein